jgi:hypothetical protein
MRDVCVITNMNKVQFNHTAKATFKQFIDKHVKNSIVFTYFAYNPINKLTKIGRSTNHINRLKILSREAGCDVILINSISLNIERKMHDKYSQYRVSGEWFSLSDEILNDIKRIA